MVQLVAPHFFPSKNLGCYGDGGAIFTNDDALAEKLKMIANHGQKTRYYHEIVGCNSRLDALQAAILNIKLPLLDGYIDARRKAADFMTMPLQAMIRLQFLTVPIIANMFFINTRLFLKI